MELDMDSQVGAYLGRSELEKVVIFRVVVKWGSKKLVLVPFQGNCTR